MRACARRARQGTGLSGRGRRGPRWKGPRSALRGCAEPETPPDSSIVLAHGTDYIGSRLNPTGTAMKTTSTSEPSAAPDALPDRFNIAAHLLAVNAERGAKVAYIDDTTRLTYAELDERVRRCAAGLQRLGLRSEDRVLLALHDSIDFPIAFLGALYAGIVPVAVNTLLTADDYAFMLEHSRARAALVSRALWPTIGKAVASARRRAPGLAVIAARPGAQIDGARPFGALLEAEPLVEPADTLADDFGFWLYSSGSTGRPKGTVHTHANLYWTAALYGTPVLGVREDDVVFSAAKMFFAYGLGNAFTFPLSVGATTVLMAERPTPQAVFQRLVRHKPTVFAGVPTLYMGMLASPELPPREQTALRICASA